MSRWLAVRDGMDKTIPWAPGQTIRLRMVRDDYEERVDHARQAIAEGRYTVVWADGHSWSPSGGHQRSAELRDRLRRMHSAYPAKWRRRTR